MARMARIKVDGEAAAYHVYGRIGVFRVFPASLQKLKKFAATFFGGSDRPDCSAVSSGLTLV